MRLFFRITLDLWTSIWTRKGEKMRFRMYKNWGQAMGYVDHFWFWKSKFNCITVLGMSDREAEYWDFPYFHTIENRVVGIWIAFNWVGDGERQTTKHNIRRCQLVNAWLTRLTRVWCLLIWIQGHTFNSVEENPQSVNPFVPLEGWNLQQKIQTSEQFLDPFGLNWIHLRLWFRNIKVLFTVIFGCYYMCLYIDNK